jgi:SAM-dependent methyltransferase
MSDKNWYEKWFSNKYYLEIYSHRDEKEARDIINLIQRCIPLCTNSKVLDVCCGAGRHSIELARRGYKVTGFDLSSYLISQAVENLSNSKESELKVEFLIKDMKNFSFSNEFDIAINIFTSFGYFETDEENFKVFGNVKKSLKPGGYFVFDFINPDYLIKSLVSESEDVYDGMKILQKRRIENNFVYKDIFIGDDKYTERLRLYNFGDINSVFNSLGFEIVNTFGDYFGNPFDRDNSKRMVYICKTNI